MNNSEALLILAVYPNDPVARAALRRNNSDLFTRVITKWWGGKTPLIYEILLTRCAEGASEFVPWKHDATQFLAERLEHECRVLYARSKMSVNPVVKIEKETDVEIAMNPTEKAIILREVCLKQGHLFHRTDYVYARDPQGRAFTRGPEWRGASKHMRVFCARCTDVIEIEIAPPLEVRKEKKEENNIKTEPRAAAA